MSTIKVLVIDDEPGFAETLAERLKIRDINVCIAETGKHGVSMMSESKPDVVLLDFFLPDMEGPEVLTELKIIDPAVEVILISGCSLETLDELKGTAFACISKPLQLAELLDGINAANHKRMENLGS